MAEMEPERPDRALQLTFSVDRGNVVLLSSEPIEMTPLPSDSFENDPSPTGFAYELQDARGRAVYRRIASDPISGSIEVPTGDPNAPLGRHPAPRGRRTFFLVIPDLAAARDIVLFGPPLARTRERGKARQLGRFGVRGHRERGQGKGREPR